MRRLFVQGSGGQLGNLMAWDIRQGLPELYVGNYSGLSRGDYYFSGASAIPMPDGTIYMAGHQNNNFTRINNIEVGVATSRPVPSFEGLVYCQAVSDRYWAIGGASPFLYVFDRLSFDFITVATTGLSNFVSSLDFSPDGSRLAVCTFNPSRTRLYNTTNWTYVDSTNYFSNSQPCAVFTPDGSRLVVVGSHPSTYGYVSTYNPETLALISGPVGISTYTGFTGGWTWTYSTRYVIFRGRSGKEMFAVNRRDAPIRFNGETLVINGQGGISSNTGLAIDRYGDRLLTNHVDNNYYVGQLTLPETPTLVLSWINPVCFLRISTGNPDGGTYPFVYTSNPHQITGTVRDITNNPAARVVQAFRRSDGVIMAQTTSDETTGDYRLEVFDTGPYDVRFKTADGELLNDLFYANVTPEPVV